MARQAPKTDVLRALFARSGNQCAFPGCCHTLINNKNQFIAQVCHIEAASKGGERYNPEENDEQRRSYENLVIFCYAHHIETDDVEQYSVKSLIRIKKDHEQKFINSDFKFNDAELSKITNEMEIYWSDIDRRNRFEHVYLNSGLAMKVNGSDDFFEVMENVIESISGISNFLKSFKNSDEMLMRDLALLLSRIGISFDAVNDIAYYDNPFVNRNWELHNVGAENLIRRLQIDIVHLKIKFLEEYIKNNEDDSDAREYLEREKEVLNDYAGLAIYFD